MDKNAYIARLLDFYGGLLTQRQRFILSQRLDEDISAAELAGLEGMSRQGVYDTLRKAEGQLLQFEEKLGFFRRYFTLYDGALEALDQLRAGNAAAALLALEKIYGGEEE